MREIYTADQADRKAPGGDMSKLDWSKIDPRDEARRKDVRAMLERGELNTGVDFEEASYIFQHGATSNDLLLAHVLAMAAVMKGDSKSTKMTAMTLDRYLQSIQQPQIFGNNYRRDGNGPWTQEPFNRQLVPERLRAVFCLPNEHIQ